MSYRDRFYSKYVSTQTDRLYGQASLGDIKKQFPVWQKYFGRFLPKDKNAKIIDLGCGNGGIVYWLQEMGYRNAEGIDTSAEQIEAAKKLGIKNIHQSDIKKFLNIETSDVRNIDRKDFGTSEVQKVVNYNVVFLRDVLEHFTKEEVLDVMEKVFESLKDNGIVIIQTPNAENPFSGRLHYGDFTHEISFTKDSIHQVLLVSGFKNVEVYPMPPVVHGLKSLIRYILWKLIEFGLRFYLLIETGSARGIFTQSLIVKAKK